MGAGVGLCTGLTVEAIIFFLELYGGIGEAVGKKVNDGTFCT